MTVIEVLEIVKDHTGEDVTPETEVESLGLDSLELLDLLVSLDIPAESVSQFNTVADIIKAAK